jgi:hypothetical protein
MAVSTIVKTKCDGTILIEDSGGTNTLTVAYENGDMAIDIPGRTVSVFLDRGKFGSTPSLRYGDDQPVTFSFTAHLRDLSDAAAGTLMDIISNGGHFAASWVSRGGSAAEVKTVQVTLTIEGTNHGDAADHTIVMDHCHLTGSISEGDPDTISLSGTAYIQYPTVA